MSAPILIDVPPEKQSNFFYIAALELKHGLLDIVIRRPLPKRHYYEVNINELELPDDLESLLVMYEDI